MLRRTAALPLIAAMIGVPSRAEDWPTYQHDNHRSGTTSENLPAATLREQWVYESPQPPQPAWAGPAKWDAYAGIRPLRSMRNYDPVFHAIAVGDALYFGSSADDSVHCLDAATGRERWAFCTDGPVRMAPTFHEGQLYFGSDDGHAYCIRAADGGLLWKSRPAPDGRQILNNGRFIPFQPCRTGVLVEDGTAYFAAALLPWKKSFLCALDAKTGSSQGQGRFVRTCEGLTLEGAILTTADRLIVPQGRVEPLLFRRADGGEAGKLTGGGGCFALVTSDSAILHGPGNKTGWITESNGKTLTKVASYDGGNAMVVSGGSAYLLTDTELWAIDRAKKRERWKVRCGRPYALILAGDTLYAGGQDEVGAFRTGDGRFIWKKAVRGRAQGLAVAGGALFVSTDEGTIHCFRAGGEPSDPGKVAKTPATPQFAAGEQPTLAAGPYLQFVSLDSAEVRWQTPGLSPSILEYGLEEPRQRIEEPALKTDHTVTLTGLRRNRVYSYVIRTVIDGKQQTTPAFECDTFFNYSLPNVADQPSPFPAGRLDAIYTKAADRILSETRVTQGMCLVLGCGEGRLAWELARRSKLHVVGVDTDATSVETARRILGKAGCYGRRIAVRHVKSLSELPFTGCTANLIVSDRMLAGGTCEGNAAEMFRLLRPGRGVACLGRPKETSNGLSANDLQGWLRAGSVEFNMKEDDGGLWATVVRPPLSDIGEWSHQYGKPDNTAYGGEPLGGAAGTSDLEVQWVGQPGPRAQPDRNGRKPSPLSTNGRLFVQGLHRILAMDSYNGTILWSLEIPPLQRFNMPRDCGNWCADDDRVFAAIGGKCWCIDAATGKVSRFFDVAVGARKEWSYDWGYVARDGDRLIGSAVKKGTAYSTFWGGSDAGWYDATKGPATFKVCSENLFSMNPDSGKVGWTYTDGLIINSTITIGADRACFIETRNAKVKASSDRQVGMPDLWKDQFLVALDVRTGAKLWERAIDTADGEVAFYLAYSREKLVLVASGGGKYYVYAYAARDGADQWSADFPWPKDNHGAHMSRPMLVGDAVYVRPRVFQLATGALLDKQMPDGGCGTYAATDKAILFRAGNVTLWNPESGTVTSWARLRPDCWLSTIPACGMVLSPEGGGGCSCGSWMETSVGFLPTR